MRSPVCLCSDELQGIANSLLCSIPTHAEGPGSDVEIAMIDSLLASAWRFSLCGFRWSSAWRFCALRHEDGSGAPAALEPSLRPPSAHYHSLPRGVSFADQAGQLHLPPEHSSKQFVGEGFCCKKVMLLIMG